MRLISYNIHYGLGKDGRFDLARIAEEVCGGDIVALQEVERYWRRSGMRDQVAELADHLPEHHWVYGPGLDTDASYRDEGGRVISRRTQFGNMLLARYPILSSRNLLLPKWGTVQQYSIQRAALEGVVATPAGPVRVYSVHLHPIAAAVRMMQVEALLELMARAPREGGAWCGEHRDPTGGWTDGEPPPMPREAIVLGDLNLTHDSAEYERLVGPHHPGQGRLVNVDGLADAWVAAGHAEESGATGTGVEETPRRIDHCLLSAWLAPRVRSAWVDTEAQGSDHQPLHVEIDLDG